MRIIMVISRYLYKVPEILKQIFKYLFDCLLIPPLEENACRSLLRVLVHGEVYIINSEIFNDILASISCSKGNSV
jgi:hypothetical protein